MEAIKEFISKCINYLKANPMYAIILAAAAVFVLVVLIVIISLCAKRSKAKKKLAARQKASVSDGAKTKTSEKSESAQTVNAVATQDEAAKKQAEKEKAEAARKAVFEKLEAQRLEAEKEEAEKLAAEKAEREAKEAAEKAEAERIAAEEAAAAEAKAKAEAEEAEKAKAAEKAAKAKTATKKKSPAKAKNVEETEAVTQAEATEATEVTETTAKKETPAKEKAATAKKATKAQKQDKKEAEKNMLYDELKDVTEEDDVWYDENETEKIARYTGKWSICHILTDDHNTEDEMYFFELHASNGEKLLSSEEYTSYNGALRGIETHKANILKGNFKITLSKKGDYIFKLLSGKNMLLCMGENYPTKARCESAIASAKRFARTAVIDENVQDYIIKVPAEDDGEIQPPAEGYNGKWLISSREDSEGEKVYFFELFANNGEKLLSSEEYTTYIGAVNGIQTHKTNISKGNFRISLTKRGDYIYKLLNGNGQLLCLGEHYKTKARCQSAVESVKRFAMNSPVLTDSESMK